MPSQTPGEFERERYFDAVCISNTQYRNEQNADEAHVEWTPAIRRKLVSAMMLAFGAINAGDSLCKLI